MSIASFVAVPVVLCFSGASAQGECPCLAVARSSFLSASGTSAGGDPADVRNAGPLGLRLHVRQSR
jgi:hypothetical protein